MDMETYSKHVYAMNDSLHDLQSDIHRIGEFHRIGELYIVFEFCPQEAAYKIPVPKWSDQGDDALDLHLKNSNSKIVKCSNFWTVIFWKIWKICSILLILRVMGIMNIGQSWDYCCFPGIDELYR